MLPVFMFGEINMRYVGGGITIEINELWLPRPIRAYAWTIKHLNLALFETDSCVLTEYAFLKRLSCALLY